jgi:cytochrome bd-type quinol oxidase subunit 2
MRSDIQTDKNARRALLLAQLSCLAFGLGLLALGFTPAVVQRLASRQPPQLEVLTVGSLTLLLGAVFLALFVLIRRGLRWALWATICISIALLAGTLGVSLLGEVCPPPIFSCLMATGTALTSLLAIAARRSAQPVERSSQPAI